MMDNLVTEDYGLSVFSEENDYEQMIRWKKIEEEFKRGMIFERPIAGVEPPLANTGEVLIVTFIKEFKVLIPASLFFTDGFLSQEIMNLPQGERVKRTMSIVSKMKGALIQFKILNMQHVKSKDKYINDDTFAILGSRVAAMKHIKDKYFSKLSINEAKEKYVGKIVEARTVFNSNKGLTVSALGVETTVPISELSSCIWVDQYKMFPPGKVIKLFIMDVIYLENDKIELVLSRKPLDEKEVFPNLNQCREGSVFFGTIVGITKDAFFINLEGPKVRAVTFKNEYVGPSLTYGSNVSFTVKNVDIERKLVVGNSFSI